MKILYCGYFRENSSWNEVATNYVKALSHYTDVVCRNVTIQSKGKMNPFIQELEEKSLDGITHVIQHVLPYHMAKVDLPSVGFAIIETDSIAYNGYKNGLDLMDQVWTPSKYHSQFNEKPYQYVPHCFHMDEYKYNYRLPKHLTDIIANRYTFYTIGEMNTRKRLSGILRAFHTEFSTDDNVALVIKTSKDGLHPDVIHSEFEKINDSIAQNTRLKKSFVEPIVISQRIDRQDILALHQNLDCYVNTSFGEAFCVPAFEACAFNRASITPDIPGIQDYAKPQLKTMLEPCFGTDQYLVDLHTSKENWWSCDLVTMAKLMRQYYTENKRVEEYDLSSFSMENVGKVMVSLLENL